MKEIEVKIQLKNNLIKQRRVDLKMTQKQLAQIIGWNEERI
jgi:DNA-binding XRE family transcriptional regulator